MKPMTAHELSRALDALELNQYSAADLVGRKQPAFSKWVLGQRKIPPELAILLRLLLAKKVSKAAIEAAKRG